MTDRISRIECLLDVCEVSGNKSTDKEIDVKRQPCDVMFAPRSIMKAYESLSDEQKECYRSAGNQIYNFNYTNPLETLIDDSFTSIAASLEAGMNPSELNKDEIALLEKYNYDTSN